VGGWVTRVWIVLVGKRERVSALFLLLPTLGNVFSAVCTLICLYVWTFSCFVCICKYSCQLELRLETGSLADHAVVVVVVVVTQSFLHNLQLGRQLL